MAPGTALLLGGLLLWAALWPVPAWAEPAGYYATPSLTLSGVFDDNVFLTSARREADFITRLTPGLRFGYRSAPLTLVGDVAFDAEKYVVNPELDNVADRQRGGLELRYLPDPRLVLGLTAAYLKTDNPVELSQQKGLQPVTRVERGRESTTGFTVSPTVSYQLTPIWSGGAGYSFSRVEAERGTTTTEHDVNLGLTRLFTVRDTGSLKYILRRFEDDTGETQTSHTLAVGWIRRLTGFTTVTLQAGPRFTEGDVGVEAFASVQHRLRFVDLSLSYARTEAVAVGQSGAAVTDTVAGQATFQLLRALQVSVGPSFQRSSPETGSGRSDEPIYYYSVGAGITYQINRWLTARAAYAWSLQDSRQQILHNLLFISLIAGYPLRLD